ncbi:transcription elongation factor GreA [Eubacteriales bacterium OttesenSCG-928-G02]|nr:transcription elongation factor GreA [Eubacteriales bacterium OttesenSCG-928-G02]
MAKIIYVSKEGFSKLESELEFLKTVKRQEVAQAIKKARAYGDLSENSEYDEAKNEQGEIESKIAQLEETINNAVILEDKDIKTDKVNVGNIVKVYDVERDKEAVYTIVGSTEADPFQNKISDDSPIGQALIGAREGDTITAETPKGVIKYTIISISK